MVDVDEHTTGLGMRIGESGRKVVDPADWYATLTQQLQPLIRGAAQDDLPKRGEQLLAVSILIGEWRVTGIASQVGAAGCLAQQLPKALLRACDRDPSVACLERLERHDRWMG